MGKVAYGQFAGSNPAPDSIIWLAANAEGFTTPQQVKALQLFDIT